ncbi:TPA: hypothetical protein RRY60_005276 [Klebsiella pneumoniae]|nr:hypothetical protein [Klebsiella pneumoniae]HDZ9696917.1 hypothetical protein [Klebsiella pneumoniae]
MELYKYFSKEEYKNDYLSGKIRLGTLIKYRGIKNAQQGDREEGTSTYRPEHLEINDENIEDFKAANPFLTDMISITGKGAKLVIKDGSTIKNTIHDAYLVCATTVRDDDFFTNDFGGHCIKIIDAVAFSNAVMYALADNYKLNVHSAHAEIEYTKTESTDLMQSQDPVFSKPESYSSQKEYRFLWEFENPSETLPIITVDIGKELASRIFVDVK